MRIRDAACRMALCAAWAGVPPAAAQAADLMDTVAPDAKLLVGIQVERILKSAVGQAIRAETRKSVDQFGEMFRTAEFDPLRDIREVLISSRGGQKNPPLLVAARGRFGQDVQDRVARMEATRVTQAGGVRIYWRAGGGNNPMQALAFPDGETALAGDLEQVRAALRGARRAPEALAAKAAALREQYDLWVVADSPGVSLPAQAPGGGGPVPPQAMLNSIRQFSGGLRFGNDLEMAAELTAQSEAEAQKLADALQMLAGLFRQKSAGDPKAAQLLERVRFGREGSAVRLGLTLPQAEVTRALRARAGRAEGMAEGTAGAEPPRVGSNEIRIESSPKDMGTVVIPMGGPK
ncbi:MAG: hypothetical protein IT158_29480 [Bryobacterales bacterium]|nr:hypothetical protein [Bryobacterales bacterium]